MVLSYFKPSSLFSKGSFFSEEGIFADVKRQALFYIQHLWAFEVAGLRDLIPASWWDAVTLPHLQLASLESGVDWAIVSRSGEILHRGQMNGADYSLEVLDRDLDHVGFSRAHLHTGLIFPKQSFFERSFPIPSHMRDRLAHLIVHELSQRTPFKIGDVFLKTEIDTKDQASGILRVQEWIIRRDFVEKAALQLSIPLHNISFVTFDSRAFMDLDSKRRRAEKRDDHFILAFALAAIGLVVLNLGLSWHDRAASLEQLTAQTSALREQALKVASLQHNLEAEVASLQALNVERMRPCVMDVWREIARILPSHTWLTDVRLQHGTLTLSGFSSHATDLVRLFDESRFFQGAHLGAPITMEASSGHEQFSLIVSIKGSS